MLKHQQQCKQQEDVYSLLVQVEKLQVALRHVTAERDALAAQLVDSSETQQECLQALLDGREQLLRFQTDLLLVRDNNEQLLHDNKR
ncbi:hypothetical protein OEZ85_013783 [Tetradesmus obliquus]|uniref:Uncharacterized protein n=1 Tax=Tetradesmus obliquus TaxID=3088 RepID=A0ABY8U6L2_TETOB|nr:hypothetical protein OEZ85_013783 [Tetradesmus obliquus]